MADPRHLLYTDFDGERAGQPGAARRPRPRRRPASRAGARPRRGARRPGGRPVDRLFACLALTAWGEETRLPGRRRRGLGAAAVARPVPRRLRPADTPFGLVAAQVGTQRRDGGAQGHRGRPARRAARPRRRRRPRGLRRPARRGDLHRPPVRGGADVVAAARRGLRRLDRRPWPPFDLPCQLVDILEPLVEVDEPTALALVAEIVRRDHSPRTLGYVAFLVATGTTSAADALAAHIVAVGGPAIAERLAERARRAVGLT